MRSEPSLARSRTRGQRTATGPMPVMISRSGRCPWRTSRWRPSSVSLSAWLASKTATSASTACASSARAPWRRISVSGSAKVPGWQSWKTLALVTAYHSFGGEVEASSTPTIRRLTTSCRHQLSLIALGRHGMWTPETARTEAKRLLGLVASKVDPASERIRPAETFGAELDRYLERKQSALKPRSMVEIERHLRVQCKSLHNLRLGEIDRRTIALTLADIEAES